MEERISIITPDHVELDFEVAGIGSRLLAFIMDQVLLYLGILAIVLLMIFTGSVNFFSGAARQWSGTVATTLLVFIIFLLNWGYFVAFEALNKGQTPGKRWTGVRVVQDSGLPIGWRKPLCATLCASRTSCLLRPASSADWRFYCRNVESGWGTFWPEPWSFAKILDKPRAAAPHAGKPLGLHAPKKDVSPKALSWRM
jgi:uncharacterized RDD family membrane protein YckC